MKKFSIKNVFFNAFVIFTLLVSGFVAFLLISGTKGFAVQTDSMSPFLSKGDAVFVRQVPFEELRVGDVVSVNFKDSSGVFTHRVCGIDSVEKLISTKGDHNISQDPAQSSSEQIIGKYYFSIPYIGYLALNVKSYTILYFLIAIAVVLVVTRMVLQSRKNQAEGGSHA